VVCDDVHVYEILVGEIVIGAVIIVLGVLKMYDKLVLANKLLENSQKLSGQISRAMQELPDLRRAGPEYVSGALGDIGIAGIMNELGIDPGILKNPLVKGLVDKYAPRVLEQLAKHGDQSQNQEKYLL